MNTTYKYILFVDRGYQCGYEPYSRYKKLKTARLAMHEKIKMNMHRRWKLVKIIDEKDLTK